MALYKRVNGKRRKMGAREEAEVRAEWEVNAAKKIAREPERAAKREEAKAVLQRMGITEEEFKKLMRDL